jgi:mRNA deadenylase 3'-5' endonuclease subunit Ccr4
MGSSEITTMTVESSLCLPNCSSKYSNGTSFSSILLDEKQSNVNVTNDVASESPLYLSVASFNLLADCYVRPYDHRTQSVQSFAAFEWVKDDRWLDAKEFRHPKLLEMLQNCHADVICLQELQLETTTQPLPVNPKEDGGRSYGAVVVYVTPQWIQQLLQSSLSYSIRLPPQKELQMIAERNQRVLGTSVAVTCAILVRNDPSFLWRIIDDEDEGDWKDKTVETKASAAIKKDEEDSTTCVSVYLRYAHHATTTTTTHQSVMVFSVHLDATDEYKRVRQIEKCLQMRRQRLVQQRLRNDTIASSSSDKTTTWMNPDPYMMGILPIIIAGDMNSEMNPGSCVNCFLVQHDDDATINMRLDFDDDGHDDTENEQNENARNDTTAALSVKAECASAMRLSTDSLTPAQLQEWNAMRRNVRRIVYDQCVRLRRVELGPTRSAYHFENTGQMTCWKLDHILYDVDTLQPVAIWETLEADTYSQSMGLPNAHCPSDHLPIGAVFQVRTLEHPKQQFASWTHIQELLARIDILSTRQQDERQNIEARFNAELLKLEQSLSTMQPSDVHDDDDATTNNKDKKKKPKGPPLVPVMECMRQKRTTLRQLGANHQTERREFVNRLGFVERRALFLKTNARTWVELGGRL